MGARFVVRGVFCRAAVLTVALHTGCGGNDSPAGPGGDTGGGVPTILYSRHRDPVTHLITPVLTESGSGFDAREVDSPAVVVDEGRSDKFLLFYEAESGTGVSTIGLVTSGEEDLQPVASGPAQVVGVGSPGSGYETAATDPTVIVDPRPTEAARKYKMWFEGRSGTASTILYGTSADGVTWSAFTACPGLDASFAAVRVADPTVVLDGDIYRMWFEAIATASGPADGPGAIGYADSPDGVHWTVRDAQGRTGSAAGPVFSAGGAAFDAYSVNAPSVVIEGGGLHHLWYEAGDVAGATENTIGHATSANGLAWTRETLPVLIPSSDSITPLPFDSGDLEHPSAVIVAEIAPAVEGHFLLWYAADSEGSVTPNRIGLARGSNP